MERTKTRTIDFGELGERDVEITVNYTPGVAESGRFGRPEDYDPGCDSEADIVSVTLDGINIYPLFSTWSELAKDIKEELDGEPEDFEEPEREQWAA